MNNLSRSKALVSNAFFTSFLTVIITGVALFKSSSDILSIAIGMFIATFINILLGMVFDSAGEEEVPAGIKIISFIMILPLTTLVFVWISIKDIFNKIFKKGDDYYDE